MNIHLYPKYFNNHHNDISIRDEMSGKDSLILFIVILSLAEGINLLISLMPGTSLPIHLTADPSAEQFTKSMGWIMEFLVGQIVAIPTSLIISLMISIPLKFVG